MRCDYCGWINEKGSTRCMKCNQILVEKNDSTTLSTHEDLGNNNTTTGNNSCSYCSSCGYPIATNSTNCPACNAPIESLEYTNPTLDTKATMRDISMVGASSSNIMRTPVNENFATKMKKTVRDGLACAETAMATPSGESQQTIVSQTEDFKKTVLNVNIEHITEKINEEISKCRLTPLEEFGNGQNVIIIDNTPSRLSRKDIEQNNLSIDEKEHIGIEYSDGKWYVENLSHNNNTYIRVDRKTELINGDVIVIGNKKFIFSEE